MEFDTDKFSTRNLFMLHVDTDWSQVDINELHLSIIKRCYFIYEDSGRRVSMLVQRL